MLPQHRGRFEMSTLFPPTAPATASKSARAEYDLPHSSFLMQKRLNNQLLDILLYLLSLLFIREKKKNQKKTKPKFFLILVWLLSPTSLITTARQKNVGQESCD